MEEKKKKRKSDLILYYKINITIFIIYDNINMIFQNNNFGEQVPDITLEFQKINFYLQIEMYENYIFEFYAQRTETMFRTLCFEYENYIFGLCVQNTKTSQEKKR